jgi:hypothetical protein
MSGERDRRAEVLLKPMLSLTREDLDYLTNEEYRWYLDHKAWVNGKADNGRAGAGNQPHEHVGLS